MSEKSSSQQPKKHMASKTNKRADIAVKRGTRLRFLRKITGMVTEPFGNLCGVGRTTISSWEQGINVLTERGAEKVVSGVRTEGIHCTTLWILHGIGEPPKIVNQDKLSKLNYQSATASKELPVQEVIPDYEDTELQKELDLFKACYPDHLICKIEDDTMHPGYAVGNFVGGILLPSEALDLAHDMDCIAKLKDGLTVVRRVKVETPGAFKLSLYGTNAQSSIEHPPLRYLLASQFTGLAPIIRIWRKRLPLV